MEEETIWEEIKHGNLESLKKLHVKYFHQMCLFARKYEHKPDVHRDKTYKIYSVRVIKFVITAHRIVVFLVVKF
jgi:hypothetical protein